VIILHFDFERSRIESVELDSEMKTAKKSKNAKIIPASKHIPLDISKHK
jgi:hypothetical protein